MTEKELMYIEDVLSHLQSISDYLANYTIGIEDENFKSLLEGFEKLNKEWHKKFLRLIEG